MHQLEFLLFSTAPPVLIPELFVWEALLRIAVERFGVTASGRAGQVIHHVLDVFTVIALGIAEAEEAFFQNGILAVPEHRGETEQALLIAVAEQPVFAPAISAQMAVVKGK